VFVGVRCVKMVGATSNEGFLVRLIGIFFGVGWAWELGAPGGRRTRLTEPPALFFVDVCRHRQSPSRTTVYNNAHDKQLVDEFNFATLATVVKSSTALRPLTAGRRADTGQTWPPAPRLPAPRLRRTTLKVCTTLSPSNTRRLLMKTMPTIIF